MVRGCPLVVHYWADLQSVHRFRCYDNTAPTRDVSECLQQALAVCLVEINAFSFLQHFNTGGAWQEWYRHLAHRKCATYPQRFAMGVVQEEIQTDQPGSPGKQWSLVMGINGSDNSLTETYSDNVRPSLTVFLRFVVQLVEALTHVRRPRRIPAKTAQQRIFCFLFRDLLKKDAIYSVSTKNAPPQV